MLIERFDEAKLAQELNRLSVKLRVVFAASCAQRLLPAYRVYCAHSGRGDSPTLEGLLTRLWCDLEGRPMSANEIRGAIETCMHLIPREDDEPWVDGQAGAEDAASAVAYALRCRETHERQEAAWAARCAYEALDHFVINRENIDTNLAGAESRIVAHPLIQAELRRQRQDLDYLLSSNEEDEQKVTRELRERAKKSGSIFFGAPS
jgi:uncharacterized protein YjaG (DUF416 family)